MVVSQLFGDLTGTELGKGRKRLAQASAFAPDTRSHGNDKQHHNPQQQQVNYGDRPAPPPQQLFQVRHQRTHQVGKEDGKEEGDQRAPGDVEKPQPQRKQQHRDQNPRRSCIRQRQINAPSTANQIRAAPLVSHYFGISVRNQDTDQLELVFFIHPKRPREGFALQVQAQQLPLRAPDGDLLSSHQFHAYWHRGLVLRHQYTKLHRSLLALKITVIRTTVGGQVTPRQHFALHKEVIIQDR